MTRIYNTNYATNEAIKMIDQIICFGKMGYLPVCSEAELKNSFFITQSFSFVSGVFLFSRYQQIIPIIGYSLININKENYLLQSR